MTSDNESIKVTQDYDRKGLAVFVDGELICRLNRQIFGKKFKIPPRFASQEDLIQYLEKKEQEGAKKYLLRILSRQSLTTDEAKFRLYKRGVQPSICSQVVEMLSDYFDDASYLTYFIDRQLEKGCGPKIIEQKLKAKGISPDKIENALQNISEEAEKKSLDKFFKKISSKEPITFKERQKIFTKLLRKGFSSDIVSKYLSLMFS